MGGLRDLELEGSGMALGSIPCLACVIEADGSGMALGSIPCLAYVIGAEGSEIFCFFSFYFLNL